MNVESTIAPRRRRGVERAAAASLLTIALSSPFGAVQAATGTDGAAPSVKVTLTQRAVVPEGDHETLIEAHSVKPGDLLEYRAIYTNTGAKSVTGFVASLPLAEGLEYVAASANPGGSQLQLVARGGLSGAEPLMRKDPTTGRLVAVPLSEIRTLRWPVKTLAAHASVEVSARAHVAGLVTPAPSVKPTGSAQ